MKEIVCRAPWTVALALVVAVVNLGLFVPWIDPSLLEFERRAVERGEGWRLVTGSLVHWSGGHLLLDLGALLVVGCLFERSVGARYASVLVGAFLSVALLLLLHPAIESYRGLSAVDAGQYAAALFAEIGRHREAEADARDPVGSRLPLLASIAAAFLFAAKLAVEWATGALMLSTERLGEIGRPLPLAHVAGVVGAIVVLAAARRHPSTAGFIE